MGTNRDIAEQLRAATVAIHRAHSRDGVYAGVADWRECRHPFCQQNVDCLREFPQSLAREPSRGTTELSETAASATQTPSADVDGQLRRLADLDAQWRAVRDDLARVHRERVEVLRVMRATLSVAEIAGLLGVSRQQVHKLLRD